MMRMTIRNLITKTTKINMKYNTREDVQNLKIKFCNEIENLFQNDETIEFNNPFAVYLTEENTYDNSVVKAPFIVKRMTGGKFLEGNTSSGEYLDDLSTYDLEDIVEVAYILDTVGDKQYKILQDE